MSTQKIWLTSLAALIFSANAFAEPTKILGIHPMQRVMLDGSNVPAEFRPYLDAFGMIRRDSLHRGVCTATHLGNGYVLSAGHCFGHDLMESEIQTNAACEGNDVYWGSRGGVIPGTHYPGAYLVSHCTRILYSERILNEKQIPIRDFAIFKVDPAPEAHIAPSTLKIDIGAKISIFGFPSHRPLEWSQNCDVAVSSRSPFMFWHQCDTEGGSSGAAVIALNHKGIPEVVGIHNGGESAAHPYNYGTYFSAAREALAAQGINLDKVLDPSEQDSGWIDF